MILHGSCDAWITTDMYQLPTAIPMKLRNGRYERTHRKTSISILATNHELMEAGWIDIYQTRKDKAGYAGSDLREVWRGSCNNVSTEWVRMEFLTRLGIQDLDRQSGQSLFFYRYVFTAQLAPRYCCLALSSVIGNLLCLHLGVYRLVDGDFFLILSRRRRISLSSSWWSRW